MPAFSPTALFERLSARSRQQKQALLERCLPLRGDERVLDIGSQVAAFGDQLLERFPHPQQVTAVNIDAAHLRAIRAAHPLIHTVQADARRLPFADRSFDLVYSNAVLEHVGSREDQQAMAREVQRVGKRWFLTTPNRWFPFEFHSRLPLVSWLPTPWMYRVTKLWGYNHTQRRYMAGNDYRDTELLSARQLQRMFPDSLVVKNRVTFWPETLVVLGPRDALAAPGERTATLPA